jgi:hypothetical protein
MQPNALLLRLNFVSQKVSVTGPDPSPTFPTKATPNRNPVGTAPSPVPAESLKTSPPSPSSHGLRFTGGFPLGGDSTRPQPEKTPRRYLHVTETLANDLEFIKVGFHISRFITAMWILKQTV